MADPQMLAQLLSGARGNAIGAPTVQAPGAQGAAIGAPVMGGGMPPSGPPGIAQGGHPLAALAAMAGQKFPQGFPGAVPQMPPPGMQGGFSGFPPPQPQMQPAPSSMGMGQPGAPMMHAGLAQPMGQPMQQQTPQMGAGGPPPNAMRPSAGPFNFGR